MSPGTTPKDMGAAFEPYFAVDPATLLSEEIPSFDLYVYVDGNMVLYRDKSLPLSKEAQQRMLEYRIKQIYIHESQRPAYQGYMERALPSLLQEPSLGSLTKAGAVYSTFKGVVGRVFSNPTLAENIKRSEMLVGQTVSFLTKGDLAFRSILELSDTDYTLNSHSVNVCTLSLGLAQQVGVTDTEDLIALGIGAMLHDVGKTNIDPRIMKKRSALSHAEFELMKKHVEYGEDILRHMDHLPHLALIPVMQHNEREDGSGYPRGLTGDQIHLFGKITAIADVFDAMTTDRVFHQALSAYDAMKEMLTMPLDHQLLADFISMLGPDDTSDG